MIDLHGLENFRVGYEIMDKVRETRFTEANQAKIEAQITQACTGMSQADVKDLMGCISSLMILEDYKKENKK